MKLSVRKKNIDKFKQGVKELEEVKQLIEQKHKLTRLYRMPVENHIRDYQEEKAVGMSEYYYHGPSTQLDWMIGVSLFGDKNKFHYEKLYIFSPDDKHTFDTKEDLMLHLKKESILEEE